MVQHTTAAEVLAAIDEAKALEARSIERHQAPRRHWRGMFLFHVKKFCRITAFFVVERS